MHASGSGYSLPSMLNGPGSGSGSAGMTPSTTANSLQGILAASRRRSRAFSIESASTYDKVDLQTEANQTPNAMHASFPHEGAEMMQVGPSNLMTMSSAESHFLPVGAAPYPYRALHDHAGKVRINEVANTGTGSYAHNGRYGASSVAGASSLRVKPTKYHQQIPSGSSFGSNYMLDQSAAHAEDGQEGYEAAYTGMSSALNTSSPSGSSRYAPQAQLQSTGFYQDQRNASPTQELLTPSLVKSNSNYSVGSPFDDDEDNGAMNPMPHSPTMVPTLLQRRTTDPFSNKHSLRVINVDHDREPGTPTETTDELTDVIATPRPRGNQQQNSEESRPFSNWSSIAPSRASTGTMSDAYSTFHFDSFGGFSNGGGRTSRADSLDAGRRLRLDPPSNYKRSSSSLEFVTREGEILTPRQVSDVGFFKNI